MADRAAFLLVPCAWHGAWCWERLTPLLEAAGCVVHTPELAGTGSDAGRSRDHPSLEIWGRQVTDAVRRVGRPVILVGHSRGGVVVSRAAELDAEAIEGLIYVSSF